MTGGREMKRDIVSAMENISDYRRKTNLAGKVLIVDDEVSCP